MILSFAMLEHRRADAVRRDATGRTSYSRLTSPIYPGSPIIGQKPMNNDASLLCASYFLLIVNVSVDCSTAANVIPKEYGKLRPATFAVG